jgi:hypothetical protein
MGTNVKIHDNDVELCGSEDDDGADDDNDDDDDNKDDDKDNDMAVKMMMMMWSSYNRTWFVGPLNKKFKFK